MRVVDRIVNRLKRNSFHDPWKRYEYVRLADAVAQHVGGRTLIDVGCGEGLFTSCLQSQLEGSSLVVGMDIESHRQWTDDESPVSFLVGDASHPPLRVGTASVAAAKDLLHHAEDPHAAAEWLVRLAASRVVIIEANASNPVMSFYTRHNGDQHFQESALRQLLEEAAPNLEWRSFNAVAYPFYLPPVTSLSAVWVWPLTALMIVCFKVFRLRAAPVLLHGVLIRRKWPAPFVIFVADVNAS